VVGAISLYAAQVHYFNPDIINLLDDLARDISFALGVFDQQGRRAHAEAQLQQLNRELEQRVADRTRELENTNKELESFSYSVSHDLRAPLRSIDGFSQLLLKRYSEHLDATGKDYLERVRRASQYMGQLIDDLLQLSKVTRGELKREQIDLGKIAKKVADDLQQTNPERAVRFVLQQDLTIFADGGLMGIVMENLLGNAYKYTGKKPAAEIEFGMRGTNGESVFFVRDNGDGFNMEYAHKLFGAFQRLHGASEFEGTGIGLATVQRIIHRHHGNVWAEAKEGEGATFYFTAPQRKREN
jgi:light-regulated signal transduction histidine kinase (bacteriophytochrome)